MCPRSHDNPTKDTDHGRFEPDGAEPDHSAQARRSYRRWHRRRKWRRHRTGDTYNYLTYPGTPEVVDGGNGSGTIQYPYISRERHKHYVATLETATEDADYNGVVTANYDFTFTGKVLITNIVNNGKTGESGNCIENRLRSLNGSQVGPGA